MRFATGFCDCFARSASVEWCAAALAASAFAESVPSCARAVALTATRQAATIGMKRRAPFAVVTVIATPEGHFRRNSDLRPTPRTRDWTKDRTRAHGPERGSRVGSL